MKRNAFIFDRDGNCEHYEPDWKHNNSYTSDFLTQQCFKTGDGGASLCLSSCVSIDALLNLQQIVQSELTLRAEMSLGTGDI